MNAGNASGAISATSANLSGAITAGSGTVGSVSLSSGAITATSANLSGAITAGSGTVASVTISSGVITSLSTSSSQIGGVYLNAGNLSGVISATSLSLSGTFSISSLSATSATVSGGITAGNFGGVTLSGGVITSLSTTASRIGGVYLNVGNSSGAISATSVDLTSEIKAASGSFLGMTITNGTLSSLSTSSSRIGGVYLNAGNVNGLISASSASFTSDVNIFGNSIIGSGGLMCLGATTSAPLATEGGLYYNSTIKGCKLYNGSSWGPPSRIVTLNTCGPSASTTATVTATKTQYFNSTSGTTTARFPVKWFYPGVTDLTSSPGYYEINGINTLNVSDAFSYDNASGYFTLSYSGFYWISASLRRGGYNSGTPVHTILRFVDSTTDAELAKVKPSSNAYGFLAALNFAGSFSAGQKIRICGNVSDAVAYNATATDADAFASELSIIGFL